MTSSLAPAPKISPTTSGASSPSSPTSPSSSTLSLPRHPLDTSQPFPPFKASHFHTDLRLVLGFVASAVMIGTSAWAYLIEKDWEKNKYPCGIAVVMYVARILTIISDADLTGRSYLILSGISSFDSYRQGHTIFIGKRKMLAKRVGIWLGTSPSFD